MNEVELSPDCKVMIIRATTPQGTLRAELHSERPYGFTTEEVEHARNHFEFSTDRVNQKHTTRKVTLFGRPVYLHYAAGPPTWWFPRLLIARQHVCVGWLRRMAAVGWR